MKKVFAAMLAVLMLAGLLAGCGSGSSGAASSAPAPSAPAQQPAQAAGGTVQISVGFENSMQDDVSKAVEKWAELVSEKSGGSMELVLYPDSQLGSKSDLIDSMQMGEKVITIADGAFLADYGAPDLGILYGPYLFTDWDQVWKLVESDWFVSQNKLLNDNGLQIVSANWKLGERNLFLVDPITSASELAGRKIRVPNNQVQIEETNAIGATATPMAAGDVYQALQTGTIDGLENVNSALISMQWGEVAKYVYGDEHVYNMAIWVCGTDMFNSLTSEQQQWLLEAADEAGLYNNTLQDASAESVHDTLVNDYGVTFVECTPEDKAKLIEMCKPFYESGEKFGWSAGLYDSIMEIVG